MPKIASKIEIIIIKAKKKIKQQQKERKEANLFIKALKSTHTADGRHVPVVVKLRCCAWPINGMCANEIAILILATATH